MMHSDDKVDQVEVESRSVSFRFYGTYNFSKWIILSALATPINFVSTNTLNLLS